MNDSKVTQIVSDRPVELILCSASPRRRELLQQIGLPFRTAIPAIDEEALAERTLKRCTRDAAGRYRVGKPAAQRLVATLAREKAVVRKNETRPTGQRRIYIGSDTIVYNRRTILGKPIDATDAEQMLLSLSGRSHLVYTAVSLLVVEPFDEAVRSRQETFVTRCRVRFYPPDEEQRRQIKTYIAGGSPFDKAGGYGIQDQGALLIAALKGDYYTVVGLPIAALSRKLKPYL
jgi:septum formation protein